MRRAKTIGGVILWEHHDRYYVRVEDALEAYPPNLRSDLIGAMLADTIARDELTSDDDGDGT